MKLRGKTWTTKIVYDEKNDQDVITISRTTGNSGMLGKEVIATIREGEATEVAQKPETARH